MYSIRSARQARRAPGNLGVGLLRDANKTFWTRSSWQTEGDMRAFLLAMPHRRAMSKLAEWCDEASVVHWIQDSAQLPDWQEGHRKMTGQGRASRVHHPSAAQQGLQFPPPRTAS